MDEYLLQRCLKSPHEIINEAFYAKIQENANPIDLNLEEIGYRETFESLSNSPIINSRIPVLCNSHALGKIPPNSLVKYVGIVHDIFNVEYLSAFYDSVDLSNGSKKICYAKYRDVLPSSTHLYEVANSDYERTIERVSVLLSPVPGLNTWAKQPFSQQDTNSSQRNEYKSASKRNNSAIDMDFADSEETKSNKKRQIDTSFEDESMCGDVPDMNSTTEANAFSNTDELSCLVRIYDTSNTPKLNDIIEVVGIYTSDPALYASSTSEELDTFDDFDANFSPLLPHLPPSIAPRVHCIFFRKLGSSFPLVQPINNSLLYRTVGHTNSVPLQDIVSALNISFVRNSVLDIISTVLGGDNLLSWYVLMSVISRIYIRHEVQVVGGLILDICGIESSIANRLIECLHDFIPRVVALNISPHSLNKVKYMPYRDFDKNQMIASPLMMGDGALIIVNELSSSNEQLSSQGVESLNALRSVVALQKLPISYGCYELTVPTNNPVIILSQALNKSIICKDYIDIDSYGGAESLVSIQHVASNTGQLNNSCDVDVMRQYWAAVRLLNVSMSEEVIQRAERDFVDSRQRIFEHGRDTKYILMPSDFHRWLTLSRLVAVSHGETRITVAHWDEMMEKERERERRAFELGNTIRQSTSTTETPSPTSLHRNGVTDSPISVTMQKPYISRF